MKTEAYTLISVASWEDRFLLGLERLLCATSFAQAIVLHSDLYAEWTEGPRAQAKQVCDRAGVRREPSETAAPGPQQAGNHMANEAGELDLLPFETELVDIINGFIGSRDAAERVELMKQFQQVFTENVYGVGLTAYPGALIINKRFSNIPPGAPIFMYNWAEDNIIRERVFVAADQQPGLEVYPDTLPAAPGTLA